MKHPKIRLLARLSTFLFCGLMGCSFPATAQQSRLSCEGVPTVVQALLREHLILPNKEERQRRAAELMLKRLDSTKSLMTKSEAEQYQKRLESLVNLLLAGKGCAEFEALYRDVAALHARNEAVIDRMMKDPNLDVDRTVELVADADKRERAKDQKEREEIIRKLYHFQLANYLSMQTPLDEAKKKLRHRYELHTKRVRETDLEDRLSFFLEAYANGLDPHSGYMSPKTLEDFNINMHLSLEGIGAVLTWRDGYTEISELSPGGPAARQGELQPKDRLLAVRQEGGEPVDVVDMDLSDVVRLIRGPKGSKVYLTVLRQGAKTETLTITIVRDKIDLSEQAARLTWSRVNGKNIAILRLPSFYGGRGPFVRRSEVDVSNLLAQAQAADALVLDLSYNGGGLLQSAVDITGLFLSTGPVVASVYADGKMQVLSDTDSRIQFNGPMVVATSKFSASASEILAGALKDYHRAVLVGDDTTFGKGTVQNVSYLSDAYGALKITAATFYRPDGVSTQNLGVASDIVLPSGVSEDEQGERDYPYALEPSRINGFGKLAEAHGSGNSWKEVSAEEIERLAKCSNERVAASGAFQEIKKEADKRKAEGGIIKVADILDEKEDADENVSTRTRLNDMTPQVEEAIMIAADLASGECVDAKHAVPAISKSRYARFQRRAYLDALSNYVATEMARKAAKQEKL